MKNFLFKEGTLKELAPKWSNPEFIREQMEHHFDEIKELARNKDTHLLSEIIDLMNILQRYAEILADDPEQLEGNNYITELVVYRLQRFYTKKDL